MRLKIFLGKNKTGKSFEVMKILEREKNAFFIPVFKFKKNETFIKEFNDFFNINDEKINNLIFDYKEEIDIYNLLKFINNLNFSLSDKMIIIDEIERFSHPELIEKIANVVFELSKKINIIVTTHSPIFLQKIFKRHISEIEYLNLEKNYKSNFHDHEIVYKLFFKEKDEFKNIKLDDHKLKNLFEKFQNREINNLARILFSQNIFLLEGINDENIIYNYINFNSQYNSFFYTLIDCGSKTQIKKIYNGIVDLGLSKIFNICLFYDRDDDGKITELKDDRFFEIVNEPNLEENLFIKKGRDEYFSQKNKTIYKHDLVLKREWIIENSTLNEVKVNLDKLYNKIKEAILWMMKASK